MSTVIHKRRFLVEDNNSTDPGTITYKVTVADDQKSCHGEFTIVTSDGVVNYSKDFRVADSNSISWNIGEQDQEKIEKEFQLLEGILFDLGEFIKQFKTTYHLIALDGEETD